MKTFKLKDFERLLKKCDFDYFKKKNFVDIDLNNEETKNKIIKIYEDLSNFEGIRYVGATKVMHLICPYVFVMWDVAIIEGYKKETLRGYINTRPEGYYNFMREMQKRYKEKKFKDLKRNVLVPRAIDLHNWDKFST
ncbi:MAG: hypothetical protein ABH824_05195 [Nanoarchaeota archaeon]|nr:hypothetical protein [Nanoarchaeota archaeon]MBU1632820.1 hypothetical protein [Nanoarchaeota archaeon]MBU1876487.1 hypothetical protein [Nanoarchaeota archaeon]